jgi:hypothetical protein
MLKSLVEFLKCSKGGGALSNRLQPHPQQVFSLESVDDAA